MKSGDNLGQMSTLGAGVTGCRGHSHVRIFQNWLQYSADRACWEWDRRARYAASLITRADAELFGLSYPRFAIRVYLDDAHSSFLNLRRTVLLGERIRKALSEETRTEEAERDGQRHVGEDGNPLYSMIGDCVLRVPKRLEEGYRIIKCAVDKLYGSEAQNLSQVDATPYVNYSDFYGSCALAVAFMACAMLSDDCTGLFGLTEMPFVLARATNTPTRLGPLNIENLCALLSCDDIHLHAYHQRANNPRYLLPVDGCSGVALFAAGLRSYILSGMPVIITCDLYRLHGFGRDFFLESANSVHAERSPKALYRSDANVGCGFHVKEPQSIERMNHFLFVIGSARDEGDDANFVIHDPYGMPYLTADAKTLMRSAPYENESWKDLDDGHFISVTPSDVKLPLFVGRGGVHYEGSLGVYDLAMEAADVLAAEGWKQLTHQRVAKSKFRLIQCANLCSSRAQVAIDGLVLPKVQADFRVKLRELAAQATADWVWLQFVDRLCLVFDAGKPAPPSKYGNKDKDEDKDKVGNLDGAAIRRDFLLGIIKLDDLASVAVKHTHVPPPPPLPEVRGGLALKKSLISSYCVTGMFAERPRPGLDPLDAYFERNDLAMELYAFVQADLAALLDSAAAEIRESNPFCADWSVVRNLAELSPQAGKWAPALARAVDRRLTREGRRIDICGLATFMPDATSFDHVRRLRARAALSVVSSLASELKSLGHTVAFIELVAGSRVSRLCSHTSPPDERHLLVGVSPLEKTLSHLDDFLSDIAVASGFRGVYSIELEPGASFAINSVARLEQTASFCDAMWSKGVTVGYNLDIAHWILSRASPSRIPREVISRIAHCHICDTYRGHMDDSPLCSVRERHEFAEWLDLIGKKMESVDTRVPFSGYVSLELECAKRLEDVRSSIDMLGQLVMSGQCMMLRQRI